MLPSLRCGRGVFLAPFNVKTLPVFLVKLLSRHELLETKEKQSSLANRLGIP